MLKNLFRKKILLLLFLILITTLILTGCYDKATINTYSDPSFDKNTITRLAIFPMRNTKLAPGEAREINRKITQGIQRSAPNIDIMSADTATKKLNEADLTEEWAKFLSDYNSSGIPNTKMLFKIGDTLNVDGIMQGVIVNIQQRDGSPGYYYSQRGQTRVTVRYSILGVDSGKLLWEATSDGIRETASAMEEAPPIIEAIILAQEKIVANLPF